jgi:hypothetical protein
MFLVTGATGTIGRPLWVADHAAAFRNQERAGGNR